MALYTSDDYDLNAVGIPLTGLAAYAPVLEANVVPDADLGSPTIALPSGYRQLGLYKDDGGPQDDRDDDDPLEFFQDGYKLPGNSTVTVQIGLAEDNLNVNALIDGKEPDENGVVYVDASLPAATFLLFVATRFKNGMELRRNGVARIQAIEVDQEERGSVRGKSVTFEWVPDPLFKMSPFKKWFGTPGTVSVSVIPGTVSVAENASTKLTATTSPSGLQVSWTSSDESIATVSADGTVTGVKAGGPVTITATAGSATDTAQVTVTSAG
ncbi:Ig-like domain-containing protein [Actinomyces radicidentis]|uniref:Ig-like domain-containing protein n=1 Tax=Actinomyces radicidentis TaxID=111015 RepID=UPI0028E8F495|nr:Ig-like domain-containing protein [Actinomyces radicidentis]